MLPDAGATDGDVVLGTTGVCGGATLADDDVKTLADDDTRPMLPEEDEAAGPGLRNPCEDAPLCELTGDVPDNIRRVGPLNGSSSTGLSLRSTPASKGGSSSGEL